MINATTGITGASSTTDTTPVAGGVSALGRDAFLKLLVTQLGHQNPLEPQNDGEFIAQLATFSSLEQLTQIQNTLTRIAAAFGATDVDNKA